MELRKVAPPTSSIEIEIPLQGAARRRTFGSDPVIVASSDVMPNVRESRARMTHFANAVRGGEYRGQGSAITDVVNIGIGGSDLGPAMACLALAPYHDGPRCHFVSNVDAAHIADTLQGLDPETTLVILVKVYFLSPGLILSGL